jgi:NADP-dependent aldehyde dehydrogenase
VNRLCAAALDAAPELEGMGRPGPAALLRALADALEARRDDVVAVADRETALGQTRLDGELTRTCHQLRLFAEVLEEGSHLEAAIDHAGDTSMGPPARPAPHSGADRAGRRIRREQLPAGLLGARR